VLAVGQRPGQTPRCCFLLLNALFIIVLGQRGARGLEIDCGCFGPMAGTHAAAALGATLSCWRAVAVYRQHDRYQMPSAR